MIVRAYHYTVTIIHSYKCNAPFVAIDKALTSTYDIYLVQIHIYLVKFHTYQSYDSSGRRLNLFPQPIPTYGKRSYVNPAKGRAT